MKKILIFGAGSIGNHMAFASSKLNYNVFVTDISEKSLTRMKKKIYPLRYGVWNNKIKLIKYNDVFRLDIFFDLIIIGTPPKTHRYLFIKTKKKLKFKKILIEKPIANYGDKKILNIKDYLKKYMIFCGYNHSISPSLTYFFKIIKSYKKDILNIDIKWKEGWKGILGAHPWLKDEFDSYLGNYRLGGGALQEHSHGIHILICLLKILNIKNPLIDKKIIFFKNNKKIKYDKFSSFFIDRKKIFIKYETDMVTFPAEKKIKVATANTNYYWVCNYKKNFDAVFFYKNNKKIFKLFKKTRSSEFENELKHIISIRNKKNYINSPLNLYNALETFKLIRQNFK